jgi:hypothetical protein
MGSPRDACADDALRSRSVASRWRRLAARSSGLSCDLQHAFGRRAAVPSARCVAAEAQLALATRDLGDARRHSTSGKRRWKSVATEVNAAHARHFDVWRFLLIGSLRIGFRAL